MKNEEIGCEHRIHVSAEGGEPGKAETDERKSPHVGNSQVSDMQVLAFAGASAALGVQWVW